MASGAQGIRRRFSSSRGLWRFRYARGAAPAPRRWGGVRTAPLLAQTRLCSAWPLPLGQALPGSWATPMLTGRALSGDHPLEPWPRATLVAGMPRGMVHRDQVGCRHGRVIYGHGEHASPLLRAEVSGHLSGTRRCLVRGHTQHGWRAPARDPDMVAYLGQSGRNEAIG
jgi:hypothetical protein